MQKPVNYPCYKPEDDAGSVWGGRRCVAWSRQAGRRCKNAAMHGKDVCKFHGGKSYSGLASPSLKDGWYSKDFLASFKVKQIRHEAKIRVRIQRFLKAAGYP